MILLVAGLTFVAAAFSIFAVVTPRIEAGYYEDGSLAWKQVYQRHWWLSLRHVRTERYYRNGQLAYVCNILSWDQKYFLPDGRECSEREWEKENANYIWDKVERVRHP